MRVLHVLGSLNPGGVEAWLMHVLRHLDHDFVQFDFLVHTSEPAVYEDEARALGAEILRIPRPQSLVAYARDFTKTLRAFGPYDVVHSHVHHFSGVVLLLARASGVRCRVAHSHNDSMQVQQQATGLRRAYFAGSRQLLRSLPTVRLACSATAYEALFGESPGRVLPLGIDLQPFRSAMDAEGPRGELGLSNAWPVVGHVGSFTPSKNHGKILAVFEGLRKEYTDAHLLLVGDGPGRAAVEEQARSPALAGHVTFAGFRRDIPDLMREAMDVFIFPSKSEGLGLSLVEAQAAGLPAVVSDVIPREAEIIPRLISRRSLKDGTEAWASAIAASVRMPRADDDRRAALRAVAESAYNIEACVKSLVDIYEQCIRP